MLSAGNPYVLPFVLVAAGAYLALTILTDASALVRIGVLAFVAGVVPIALNRVLGERGTGETTETGDAKTTGTGDEKTTGTGDGKTTGTGDEKTR